MVSCVTAVAVISLEYFQEYFYKHVFRIQNLDEPCRNCFWFEAVLVVELLLGLLLAATELLVEAELNLRTGDRKSGDVDLGVHCGGVKAGVGDDLMAEAVLEIANSSSRSSSDRPCLWSLQSCISTVGNLILKLPLDDEAKAEAAATPDEADSSVTCIGCWCCWPLILSSMHTPQSPYSTIAAVYTFWWGK